MQDVEVPMNEAMNGTERATTATPGVSRRVVIRGVATGTFAGILALLGVSGAAARHGHDDGRHHHRHEDHHHHHRHP